MDSWVFACSQKVCEQIIANNVYEIPIPLNTTQVAVYLYKQSTICTNAVVNYIE